MVKKQRKRALHRDFWTEISKSKARFISIFFIVALGVAFFSGIQSSSPDMRYSGDAYFDSSKLMDLKIVSTMGLKESDIEALSAAENIAVAEGAYREDLLCKTETSQKALRVESLTEKVNLLEVEEGRLPEAKGECLVDSQFAGRMEYKTGDTIQLEKNEGSLLTTTKFEIVGIGSSPMYISFNRGNTTIGSGELNGFLYVTPDCFDSEVYTQAYLRLDGEDLISYTNEYEDSVENCKTVIEKLGKTQCTDRYDEVKKEAEAKLAEAKKDLEDGKKKAEQELADVAQQLTEAKETLDAEKKKYDDGKKALEEAKNLAANSQFQSEAFVQQIEEQEKQLEAAKAQLENGEKEYADGESEYKKALEAAEKEIADGEEEIRNSEEKIAAIEMPEWYIYDRTSLPEYTDYGDSADRMRNIGKVFPVLFFLVAALVSLTTMTRMVEENRTQIGTMKALGYKNGDIALKYLGYAFLATVGGGILGVLAGEKILPFIIIKAYGMMYFKMADYLKMPYEGKFSMIALLAAVLCTIGATFAASKKALLETPASLMRPPSPKKGKRVFLEKIPFLWKRMSFTWKSTIRNLFRYKKRLFMTIFGIAGSMSLMLVGFGLNDSISDVAVYQYADIQHYDGIILLNEDSTKEEQNELREKLADMPEIESYSDVLMNKLSAPRERGYLSVFLYVPQNLEAFKSDITLQDRISKEKYELPERGAAISEKTAKLLDLKAGDTMLIEEDNKTYELEVKYICENYLSHYIYITPDYYREIFQKDPDYNDIVFTVTPEQKDSLEKAGEEILENTAALSINYSKSLKEQLDRMLETLGSVILVLIVSAGMLAFVVLYNLNNINITERQRELATLKVLGFYDLEVSQYVFRENMILTVLGIIGGVVMGIFLHRYVIVTVEVEAVMFGRNIALRSFLYSGLITLLFSVLVNGFMHFKLKSIDMVESLKSVE